MMPPKTLSFVACLVVGFLLVTSAHAQRYAYITNGGSDTVDVIDYDTQTIVTTIATGAGPEPIAVHPDQTRVYVGNQIDNTISVIDTATNTVIATIPDQDGVEGIVVHPDGHTIYASNPGEHQLPPDLIRDQLSFIDAATNTVKKKITVGDHPWGLTLSPDGNTLYVMNAHQETITVVDTVSETVVEEVLVGDGAGSGDDHHPSSSVITPDGSTMYAVHMHQNFVQVLDLNTWTELAQIPVVNHPHSIVMLPDGSKVYVSMLFSAKVNVISTDTNTVINEIFCGSGPRGQGISPDGQQHWVANDFAGWVTISNTATDMIMNQVTVGDNPKCFGDFFVDVPSQPGLVFDLSPDQVPFEGVMDFHVSGGQPGSLGLLALTGFDLAPMFLSLFFFPFDGNGEFSLSANALSALSGHNAEFTAYGIATDGKVHASNAEFIEFL